MVTLSPTWYPVPSTVMLNPVRLPPVVIAAPSAKLPEPPEMTVATPPESAAVKGVVVLKLLRVAIPPVS